MGETAHCRKLLSKYCQGTGLDIGFGGDSISSTAINLDLETPYTSVGNDPQHLKGNCKNLYWFKNEALDYVYSSHLLEDFGAEEMKQIIKEWFRVLKIDGNFVLYCPDEQVYRSMTAEHIRNKAHVIAHFSLKFFKERILANIKEICYDVVYENAHVGSYSFAIVLRKK